VTYGSHEQDCRLGLRVRLVHQCGELASGILDDVVPSLLLSPDEPETGTCIANDFSYSSMFVLNRTIRARCD
jgi:hypothetical protein